ncbi:MAG: hypothetical protein DSM106950_39560 [Stigonema ocellatum SAG 48.90 = DSM 106950]|nr:hypothetical protein [Stigonema ocellatum SAG 48.90 = DSM 106950]
MQLFWNWALRQLPDERQAIHGGWPMQKQIVEVGGKDMLAQLFHTNGSVPLWTLSNNSLLGDVCFG